MRRINNKAFTLIELAVVILVIGILAAIVLRNIGSTAIQARDTKRVGDLKNVSNYLAQYLSKNGYFPTTTSWSTLNSNLAASGVTTGGGVGLPVSPSGRNGYYYFACTDQGNVAPGAAGGGIANHFVLMATLEEASTTNPQIYQVSSQYPSAWVCNGAGQTTVTGSNGGSVSTFAPATCATDNNICVSN